MSDLENLEALKRMFESRVEEQTTGEKDREKRFIADATAVILGKDSKVTGIQGYTPKEMIAFLEQPAADIQAKMGGEWAEMKTSDFETMVYAIEKKVKKSTTLLDWEK